MAETLVSYYGPEIPKRIAEQILAVHPKFPKLSFLRDALDGYEALNLMARGKKIARALRSHLPEDYEKALAILIRSLGERKERGGDNPISSFLYMPYTNFVSEYGLDFFEASMQAQYELTQVFTAEFSIRPFLIRHEKQTLARLKKWATDRNVHVRRLVSEGTRPRLPWAQRLPSFQKNPRPVLDLLEVLKDDPELYVRRSVANNLNDIGKDHPEILTATCRRWLIKAPEERQRLVRHALRSAIKRGEAGALGLLGYGKEAKVEIKGISIDPKKVARGESLRIGFEVFNNTRPAQDLLLDLGIHYVKASGRSSMKVFKLSTCQLAPGEGAAFSKKISLAELTTRKHYPGNHLVDLLINGKAHALGSFLLT